eukprot:TRINITY_DN6051_c0_g1_i1.p1 TRINITY_DN6051_c0_g1~~TRINITY_DN6051_c0_g1_i1.p1  ORF type:complete len:283 (-),score=104.09 TRINITY_DN6051_c0_g1_i1:220-1068(-)
MIRRSMGGHAYSQFSGIPRLAEDFGVYTTGGGDNAVLIQQTAKYLIKTVSKTSDMSKAPAKESSVFYLWNASQWTCQSVKPRNFGEISLKELGRCLQFMSFYLTKSAAENLAGKIHAGNSPGISWNESLVQLSDAVHFHSLSFIYDSFLHAISDASADASGHIGMDGIRFNLTNLCLLYGLKEIENYFGQCSEAGIVTSDDLPIIRMAIDKLNMEIRKSAILLVDAFAIPDALLNSPLGRYDGDIYQHYMKAIVDSESGDVAPYWNDLIKPHVQHLKTRSKL